MIKPICPCCGSDNIWYGGFCVYHYRNGRWVVKRRSTEMSDGGIFNCGSCGEHLVGDFEPPFNLKIEPSRWDYT